MYSNLNAGGVVSSGYTVKADALKGDLKYGALEVQVNALGTLNSQLYDLEQRFAAALDKLLNPRPEEADNGTAGHPTPATIEGQLQANIHSLAYVVAKLNDRVKRLESI